VSQALALATTDIAFIVSDLAGTASKGASLLSHAKRQSRFMKHDLFTEQVAKEANVYFFRWVFHNWNDKYCVQVLQNLIPTMKKGGEVMLYEYALTKPLETKVSEKLGRFISPLLFVFSLYTTDPTTATPSTLYSNSKDQANPPLPYSSQCPPYLIPANVPSPSGTYSPLSTRDSYLRL